VNGHALARGRQDAAAAPAGLAAQSRSVYRSAAKACPCGRLPASTAWFRRPAPARCKTVGSKAASPTARRRKQASATLTPPAPARLGSS